MTDTTETEHTSTPTAPTSEPAPATKVKSEEANAKMNERTLGRVAFETYSATLVGRTYDGKPIPPWTALPDQIKGAWEATARAVEARVTTALPKSGEG